MGCCKTMHVIFLDLEGPIVTHRSILTGPADIAYQGGKPGWTHFIDSISLKLVKRLSDKYQAKIVLTSYLRRFDNVKDDLIGVDPYGMNFAEDWRTDNVGNREDEILRYVSKHNVEKYVAIDDMKLDIKNSVRVDPREGVTFRAYSSCQKYLGDPLHELIFL